MTDEETPAAKPVRFDLWVLAVALLIIAACAVYGAVELKRSHATEADRDKARAFCATVPKIGSEYSDDFKQCVKENAEKAHDGEPLLPGLR